MSPRPAVVPTKEDLLAQVDRLAQRAAERAGRPMLKLEPSADEIEAAPQLPLADTA